MLGYVFLITIVLIVVILIYIMYIILGHQRCDNCGWSGSEEECVKEQIHRAITVTTVIKCPLCGSIVDAYMGIEL